jgi:hypothetical protein
MKRASSGILLPAILVMAFMAAAQQRMAPVQVQVTPDHADWKYAPGENVAFTIKVLRIVATAQDEGRTYRGLGTAGFAPEKIQPVTKDPEGFDKFWREGKGALAKIPINPQRPPYSRRQACKEKAQ